MGVVLTNHRGSTGGSLWFEFRKDQNPFVIPWLKSKLHEVSNGQDRLGYRRQMTKKALAEKYTHSIWARTSQAVGAFRIYACYGDWRCGTSDESQRFMRHMEVEIMKDLDTFIRGQRDLAEMQK